MILYPIVGNTEKHTAYQTLEAENALRLNDFIGSMVRTSKAIGEPYLSSAVVKAFNYHAIACLHPHAGEYRPGPVWLGSKEMPLFHNVPPLMDHLINQLNTTMGKAEPVVLAAYALWRINWIHPFLNGNGRTARSVAYFLICSGRGDVLPGAPILPELIKANRNEYCEILEEMDKMYESRTLSLRRMIEFLDSLISTQISSAEKYS